MSRRRKDPDPANLTSWLGQPYIPQDPYNRLTRGILRPVPLWMIVRGPYRYGCLLWLMLTLGIVVLAIVLSQADGLTSGVLIMLAIVTGLALLAGSIISRYLPKPGAAGRHHKKRHTHNHQ